MTTEENLIQITLGLMHKYILDSLIAT